MRVAVLPREVAASVITGAVSRMGWTFGGLTLALTVPVLVETYLRAGIGSRLAIPLVLLVVQMALSVLPAMRPRPAFVAAYLLTGGAAATAFQIAVLRDLPSAVPDHVFLVNRPAIALTVVGVVAASTVVGVGWVALGFGAAMLSLGIASALAGTPFTPGSGPFLVPALALVTYLGFAMIQRRSRARVQNIDELEAETQALVEGADLARRTTAIVHDTVLNDLAIIMNGPDRLDERTRERLRADLRTLTGGEWLHAAREVRPADEQDAQVRNAIAAITSDFQWRGLTVQISGAGDGVTRLDPEVVDAMLGAIRAALENTLQHSGASDAELAFAQDATSVSVTVADQGRGFDLSAVPEDRLGVRGSIVGRLEAVGGTARIWSTPGAGTSVVITGPIREVVMPSTPSRHREEHGGRDA